MAKKPTGRNAVKAFFDINREDKTKRVGTKPYILLGIFVGVGIFLYSKQSTAPDLSSKMAIAGGIASAAIAYLIALQVAKKAFDKQNQEFAALLSKHASSRRQTLQLLFCAFFGAHNSRSSSSLCYKNNINSRRNVICSAKRPPTRHSKA